MTLTVDAIRDCLEGTVPSTIATCSADGIPNVTLVSQVDYVDPEHVALSFQFFNKTRENVLANPQATVIVTHPDTAAAYTMVLRYLRTESEGPLFQRMKAKLAGIASHTGMADVFVLRGADLYKVERIEAIPGRTVPVAGPRRNLLAALRKVSARLSASTDLASLFDEALEGLASAFDVRHAMLLLLDETGQRLYAVGSHGYERSGVGFEIGMGEGVIGVAAEHRTAIRIAHLTEDYSYGCALRRTAMEAGFAARLQHEIPFPGLPEARSQLAVPILAPGRLAGVLYVESPEERRFSYDDEDALVALGAHLGTSMHLLRAHDDGDEMPEESGAELAASGQSVMVRHFPADDSVFIGDDYLIKGVAGAIFWKLVRDYTQNGRVDHSNRELRLDASLRLPDFADNLEARLILLSRRLAERCEYLGIEKTGRGRFRFRVDRPLRLAETPKAA